MLLPAAAHAGARAVPRQHLNLVSDVLLFLLVVVVVALVGGFAPAMVAAVVGSLLLNYYFTPPLHTLHHQRDQQRPRPVVFVVVAVLVSSVVDLAARRTRQAARATAEAETLATLAGSVLRGETALPALLDRVREAFGLTSVTLLELTTAAEPPRCGHARPGRRVDGRGQRRRPAVRTPPGRRHRGTRRRQPRPRPARAPAAGRGPARPRRVRRPGGRRPRTAPAGRGRGRRRPLAEADRTRTALLAAVGHDLRTPLASAKAAVTSLRSHDVELDAEDHDELLATADESLDQLGRAGRATCST